MDVDNQTCGASACDFVIKAVAYSDPDLCTGSFCNPGAYTALGCTSYTPLLPSCSSLTYSIVGIYDGSGVNLLCTLTNCGLVYSCSFTSCGGNSYTATMVSSTEVLIQ